MFLRYYVDRESVKIFKFKIVKIKVISLQI
jgi:hypothetical protein